MNTIAIPENQRKAGALLACLVAGVSLLSAAPAQAGAIYDAKVSELKIKTVKILTCSNDLNVTPLHIDSAEKAQETSAGTVKVTCTGASEIGLAIAKTTAGPYTDSAVGTPVAPAVGALTITVGGQNTAVQTLASADNKTETSVNIAKMVVATAQNGAFTFALTPTGTVTAVGDFTYSLASAAWVE